MMKLMQETPIQDFHPSYFIIHISPYPPAATFMSSRRSPSAGRTEGHSER